MENFEQSQQRLKSAMQNLQIAVKDKLQQTNVNVAEMEKIKQENQQLNNRLQQIKKPLDDSISRLERVLNN